MKQSSTTQKQGELLNTQKNAESNHKESSTLVEQEKIEGTPFTLIKQEKNWFMVWGDWRITEDTNTKEEQLEKLESEKWLIITHIMIITHKKLTQNPEIHNM